MAALNAVEEPFASLGLHFTDGPLAQIWQDVKVRVLVDMARLALCAAQEASCSPAARTVRNIVAEARSHDGLARVGFINRAINLAIKPTIDPFVWRSPLETLSVGAGDCKEYAVAKYLALLEVGIPEPDVKLVDRARHGRAPRPCDRCRPHQCRLVSAGQSLAGADPGYRVVARGAALHPRRAWSKAIWASPG